MRLSIVCNSFPTTADAEAVKSRSFPYKINIDPRASPRKLRNLQDESLCIKLM
jgi:hypothetical protein